MHVREMNDSDIPGAARLLEALAREYIVHDCTAEQASTFIRDNDAAALRRLVDSGFVYHVADVKGEVAGFVGVRERRHLYHLFVAKRYHGQGIARVLWEHARQAAAPDDPFATFTVNSSLFATGVYESFGFVRSGPEQCVNGLRFLAMTLNELPAIRQGGAATGC